MLITGQLSRYVYREVVLENYDRSSSMTLNSRSRDPASHASKHWLNHFGDANNNREQEKKRKGGSASLIRILWFKTLTEYGYIAKVVFVPC